ncbi:MAG: F0F1 ATP synthase subunit epsilon [Carnobacterium sp.]|jgi:F-type H+-transporting ATPase subunit epsilon|uniref:ATP synthase epsilon chain n=2 Tax=Carnobacterium maltaromaticum TaxID=2751 RepID=K8EEN4_CARML|nr:MULTISPECIES: F0F1 ATP synthase subunit epsilon [Carnobacterium]AOA01242.1 F0F1 ATP synthase subunit epsilon [Carnobacterium maltaromaticum]KRN62972.1 F0F1 ATP synthase subunit epsilon [Carnobacterium maltaromaticum DSM 20342]KRN73651.1 F0F1 ATP synthase subunit epsilon [Carnobacterium maltaromaticum]KRN84971.1 F0F1 ATP synthase subunit epsilon [Carnobacterium maltaromaticum]MBC9789923.1 F0F1 ATP synthase subunit epsilon [Carnobacterium maltaromaticum]
MSVLRVNIVTPNGLVYDHNANMVVAKTLDGEIGILPQHAPIIVPLQINEVRVKRTDNPEHEDAVAVNGGVMEVRDNICTIIADSAERERDIDLSRAERAKERAEKRIEEAKEHEDRDEIDRATVALHKAINRISVSRHGR